MRAININIIQKINGKIIDLIDEIGRKLDVFLCVEIAVIFLAMFLKIYFNGKYVAEKSRAESLKVQTKHVESETKKLRFNISKIRDKENLSQLSKNKNMENDIQLVVVK